MRTKFRTLLLSAAFALAAASQATAACEGDCIATQTYQIVSAAVVESVAAETAQASIERPASTIEDPTAEAQATVDVTVALPGDVDLQVAIEMAALAQSISEAHAGSNGVPVEAATAEVETTGSLSTGPVVDAGGTKLTNRPDGVTIE